MKLAVLSGILLFSLVACSGGGGSNSPSQVETELTGVWKSTCIDIVVYSYIAEFEFKSTTFTETDHYYFDRNCSDQYDRTDIYTGTYKIGSITTALPIQLEGQDAAEVGYEQSIAIAGGEVQELDLHYEPGVNQGEVDLLTIFKIEDNTLYLNWLDSWDEEGGNERHNQLGYTYWFTKQ